MSQSKECLSLSVEKFGSKCVIPNNLLKDFLDNSDIKTLLNSKIINEHNNLIGKTKVTSIDHLTEANKAGSNVGYKCTLFLCEGSSAKTMCETGIGVIGHDFYGCYALRGKVLNVRNSSINKYFENKELNELKIIVGLKDGEKYNEQSVKKLRCSNYGTSYKFLHDQVSNIVNDKRIFQRVYYSNDYTTIRKVINEILQYG